MDKIINYKFVNEPYFEFVKDTFELNVKTKKAKKIIKSLLNKKVLIPQKIKKHNTKRIEINKDKINQLIQHLHDEIYFTTNERPRMIIMGYEQMRELKIECFESFSFVHNLELNGSNGRKFMDLELILKPNIDGVILI